MVCVLAMLCKLIQLFMVVPSVLWHSHLGSSVMYYCLVCVTFQSVIVISNGLPYFLAIFCLSVSCALVNFIQINLGCPDPQMFDVIFEAFIR
jgi:hypothetical protein